MEHSGSQQGSQPGSTHGPHTIPGPQPRGPHIGGRTFRCQGGCIPTGPAAGWLHVSQPSGSIIGSPGPTRNSADSAIAAAHARTATTGKAISNDRTGRSPRAETVPRGADTALTFRRRIARRGITPGPGNRATPIGKPGMVVRVAPAPLGLDQSSAMSSMRSDSTADRVTRTMWGLPAST